MLILLRLQFDTFAQLVTLKVDFLDSVIPTTDGQSLATFPRRKPPRSGW